MYQLRPPTPLELPPLAALCRRSKASWGYDDAFLDACAASLQVDAQKVNAGRVIVAADDSLLGVAQLDLDEGAPTATREPEIELLFVDPNHHGQGVGRALLSWSIEEARRAGCSCLYVLSDPGARPFYERHGAHFVRDAPSDAIPGRTLPWLRFALT